MIYVSGIQIYIHGTPTLHLVYQYLSHISALHYLFRPNPEAVKRSTVDLKSSISLPVPPDPRPGPSQDRSLNQRTTHYYCSYSSAPQTNKQRIPRRHQSIISNQNPRAASMASPGCPPPRRP
jgi:hypothetical protein